MSLPCTSFSLFQGLSAAGCLPIAGAALLGVIETAAGTAFSPQQGIDDGRSAADAGLDGNGIKRAVAAAGTAFHAGISILDPDMGSIHLEHVVRADFEAHPAAGAFFFSELQGHDIAEVNEFSHFLLL
jgi:hypothetical protein